MEILNLVSELLYQHNCVIIPDFGGFVANVKPTDFETNRLLLSPTRKKVVFNQSLKDNDGLLINALVKRNGVSYEEAEKQVYLFSKFLSDRIIDYKNYEFKNIGSFYLNKEDKLIFVAYEGLNFYKPSYGLQNIKVKRLSKAEIVERPIVPIAAESIQESAKTERKWMLTFTRIAAAAILIAAFGFGLKFLLSDSPTLKYAVVEDSTLTQSADFIPEVTDKTAEIQPETETKADATSPVIEDVTEELRSEGKLPNTESEIKTASTPSIRFEDVNAQYQRASAPETVYYVAVKQFSKQLEVQSLTNDLHQKEYQTFYLQVSETSNHLCLEKFINHKQALAFLTLVKQYDYAKAYIVERQE